MIGLCFALLTSGPAHDWTGDPAFRLAKSLIGQWEGVVGKKIKVKFTFTLEQEGKLIVANGLINAGSKNPIPARSSLGWDPVAKQVYYLDQHGSDTVYFGHITREGDELVFDFNGLSGDSGHYQSRCTITPKLYSSTMSSEKDGKWTDTGFHLKLHRLK